MTAGLQSKNQSLILESLQVLRCFPEITNKDCLGTFNTYRKRNQDPVILILLAKILSNNCSPIPDIVSALEIPGRVRNHYIGKAVSSTESIWDEIYEYHDF